MGNTEKEAGGAARTSVGVEGLGERKQIGGDLDIGNLSKCRNGSCPYTHFSG